MKTFKSNEAFFEAFDSLVQRIANAGHREVAERLREGFSCLNGLTDGWGMLMQAVESVLSIHKAELTPEDESELRTMLVVIRKAVYRN